MVSAITVPTIHKNFRAVQFQTAFKKAYAETGQIAKQMMLDYDTEDLYSVLNTPKSSGSNESLKHGFAKSIEAYYKRINNEPQRNVTPELLDKNGKPTFYKNHSNTTKLITALFDDGGFELLDGRAIIFEGGYANKPFLLHYDINGMHTGPNRYGYDLFDFVLAPNGVFYPSGSPILDDLIEEAEMVSSYCKPSSGCSKTSTSNCNGTSCAYQAVVNQNYFKELK